MVAPGKTIAPNGVVVVHDASRLDELEAGHGALGMFRRPVIGYHDTRGPVVQIVPYRYEPNAHFDRHTHDGDRPMDETFYVLRGSVTFTYDGTDGGLVQNTIEANHHPEGAAILFPAGVAHAGIVGSEGAWVIVVGVRAGAPEPCDLQQNKGENIPL